MGIYQYYLIVAALCAGTNSLVQATQAVVQQEQQRRASKTIDHALDKELLKAAQNGDLKTIEKLFSGNSIPDIEAKDKTDGHNHTALMKAAMNSNYNTVHYLLAAGANPNAKNHNRTTALMLAASHESDFDIPYRDIVKELIKSGAKLDTADSDGYTALMHATRHQHEEISKLLLEAGADPYVRNPNDDKIAIDYVKYDKEEFRELFEAAIKRAIEREEYLLRQIQAKNIVKKEPQLIPEISNIIAAYAYGPSLTDLPETKPEAEAKENQSRIITEKSKETSRCIIQ